MLVGQKDNVKATMEHVLATGGEEWFHGAAYRYFGAMYAIAPKFAGGDMEKSKESFEKSMSLAPYYIGTKVLMAEHYMTKVDDEEGFKKLLGEVLAFDPKEVEQYDLVPEVLVEQQKAKELMENMDEYF